MKKIMIFVVGLMLAVVTGVAAQNGKKAWTFDTDSTGAIAKGFINEVGKWEVVADSTAPSKHNALAQMAKNSNSTFNIALVKDTNYKDLDITVKMKAIAGNMDQGGGIVWRAKDAKNYYVARFNPLEDNYNLYHIVNGRRSEIKGSRVKSSPGWHTLRVSMAGNHIQCYLDGKKHLDAKDSTFKEGGKIGLWTKSDARTHFDDLEVTGKQ
jgi:phosphoglucomutase